MDKWLISPPVAFLINFIFISGMAAALSTLALKVKEKPKGTGESYACGESNYNPMAQPDYSQFFPFAFFFTIAHVATLMVAMIPAGSPHVLGMALIYLFAVVVGLFILLGR
jgi:NADH-quinone oxidoreductase subunit A